MIDCGPRGCQNKGRDCQNYGRSEPRRGWPVVSGSVAAIGVSADLIVSVGAEFRLPLLIGEAGK